MRDVAANAVATTAVICGALALSTSGSPAVSVLAAFFLGSGLNELALDRSWPTHERDGGKNDLYAGCMLALMALFLFR